MDPRHRANHELWQEWTRAHVESRFYDVAAFRAGGCTLAGIERSEVGDVAGRRLLHLQCHFGLDTLSWARLGAAVTGVDFSGRAIAAARALAAETGLAAEFIEADVCDVAAHVTGEFDIVFTSYGALTWLPDLRRWAEAAASCLAPGGMLYIAEFHPVLEMRGDDGAALAYPYFGNGDPVRVLETQSYADGDVRPLESFTWSHTLGDVVSAVSGAGLRIDFLHEHDWSPFGVRPFMREDVPGRWHAEVNGIRLPAVYSLRATR